MEEQPSALLQIIDQLLLNVPRHITRGSKGKNRNIRCGQGTILDVDGSVAERQLLEGTNHRLSRAAEAIDAQVVGDRGHDRVSPVDALRHEVIGDESHRERIALFVHGRDLVLEREKCRVRLCKTVVGVVELTLGSDWSTRAVTLAGKTDAVVAIPGVAIEQGLREAPSSPARHSG